MEREEELGTNSCKKRGEKNYFCKLVLRTFSQSFEKTGLPLGEKLLFKAERGEAFILSEAIFKLSFTTCKQGTKTT